MQATSYLNNQDDWSQLARAQTNEPNLLATLSITYTLPFFNRSTGLVHSMFGGWQANTIVRYVDGFLISSPSGAFSSGVDPKLTSGQSYSQWFNTCSLNTSGVRQNCANTSQPAAFIQLPPYTLNTLAGYNQSSSAYTYLPGVRTEVPVNVDFALFKTFSIHEKTNVQFRASAFNLGNTAQFGNPNTTFGNTNFGVITLSQVNDPRIVELALKLNF